MNDSTVSSWVPPAQARAPAPRQPEADGPSPARWILFIHQLPPEPAYLRVKVRRRLERVGAQLLKNSVYVLPDGEDTREDLEWLRQDVEREGGEVTLCVAEFLDEGPAARLVSEFRQSRSAEYATLEDAVLEFARELEERGMDEKHRMGVRARVERLRGRLSDIAARDFFDAQGRAAVERALASVEADVRGDGVSEEKRTGAEPLSGRTWVTRSGVKVDRMGSAWLIRRFIDPAARFRFVLAGASEADAGELRFDMYEGEYTHEGDACTFEVLLMRFGLDDPALVAIGEIVHDIDCKEEKFGRAEVAGVASLIDGIVRGTAEDEARLVKGEALFDGLYEHFAAAS